MDYLKNTISSVLNLSGESIIKVQDSLSNFVEQASCNSLVLGLNENGDVFSSNSIPSLGQPPNTFSKSLILTKTNTANENFNPKSVQMITFSENPASSLYHSIHAVYLPILSCEKWGVNSSKFDKIINELDTYLLSNMVNSSQILSLSFEDEYRFWKSQSNFKISSLLEPLVEPFNSFMSLNSVDALDIIDKTQDVFDEIWKSTSESIFPQERIVSLFNIVNSCVQSYISNNFEEKELFWKTDFYNV